MPTDEGDALRGAVRMMQGAHQAGDSHRVESALERALLTTSPAGIDADSEPVATAVSLLRTADDNGTIRLEVRDQAMTRRRWFEVNANREVKWGDR